MLYNKNIMPYNNDMEKDLYLLTTGALLRQRRDAAQLTLAEVSERSGVTIAHLSRIENGLADPRLSTLQRVLDAMGGTLSDLEAPRIAIVLADTVLERRAEGRERIDRAGLGSSNPSVRLDRKERTGLDGVAERSALGSS
jgi:transcriptional regulator with XRE-family HTH domain